jgi:hypothetical protein
MQLPRLIHHTHRFVKVGAPFPLEFEWARIMKQQSIRLISQKQLILLILYLKSENTCFDNAR